LYRSTKAQKARDAGAVAVVVINNIVSVNFVSMYASTSSGGAPVQVVEGLYTLLRGCTSC
jgi:hypothetical protein